MDFISPKEYEYEACRRFASIGLPFIYKAEHSGGKADLFIKISADSDFVCWLIKIRATSNFKYLLVDFNSDRNLVDKAIDAPVGESILPLPIPHLVKATSVLRIFVDSEGNLADPFEMLFIGAKKLREKD